MSKKYVVFPKDKDEGRVICIRAKLRPEARLRAVVASLEEIGMHNFYRRYTINPSNVGYEVRHKNTPGIVAVVVDAGIQEAA